MRALMLRIAGFAGAPVLSAIAPFLIIPVVTRVLGDGWADFAAAQSIGLLGMVGVMFGWSVIGPVRIARNTDRHERAVILRESLSSRAVSAAVAIPATGIITALVVDADSRTLAVAVAVAVALGGFSPSWFCIGEGNPRALLVFDAAPKLAASALSLPILALTQQVIWYPVLLVALTLPSFAIHASRVFRGLDPEATGPRPTRAVLRTLIPTAAIDAAGNAYGSTPVPIATGALSASEASPFASADRLYRVGILAVIAVGNAFQAWVLDPTEPNRHRRHLLAIAFQVGLGILGGAAIAITGPAVTAFVLGAHAAATPLVSLWFGIAFLFISSGTPLIRNLLIPAGRVRLVFTATVASAVIGIGVMLMGALAQDAVVIAFGVALAEATSVSILLVPALRVLSAEPRTAQTPPPA